LSKKKIHYGVRLRIDQALYLRDVSNASEWIRDAIDEKRRQEQKKKRE